MHFRIRDTVISISFWFSVSLSALMLLDKSGTASCAFLSALLHEIGHIAAFTLQKRAPAQIEFTPFGLKLREGRRFGSGISYAKEIQAAVAGPLVNLIICIFAPRSHPLFLINIALFIFNMLPVYELDGGRVLHACLSMKKNPTYANHALSLTSCLCVLSAFTVFFIGAAHDKYNFSLFLATFYLGTLVLTSETARLLNRKSQ